MLLLVAGWAFAEAVLFFLVADIPISVVAVRYGWGAGAKAALVGAVAAALGGAATYGWAVADAPGAAAAIRALPAIDAALIVDARADFAAHGHVAMLWGSFSGVPYKLYALAAGSDGAALAPFLLLSAIVRLPRFLIVALASSALAHVLSRRIGKRAQLSLLAVFWTLSYAWYFTMMPG